MKLLVIAEHDNSHVKNGTLNTVTAALTLLAYLPDLEIHLLVAGLNCLTVAQQGAKIAQVKQVIYVDNPAYAHRTAENLAHLVKSLAHSYNMILAPATTFGKNFLPRVAALLDVEQISDVCGFSQNDQQELLFVHPIYAGNALETVMSTDAIKVLTVRTSSFALATFGETTADIIKIEGEPDLELSRYVGTESTPSERPELTQAKIIVAGGRGFQSAEKFKAIEPLADKLHAAIGASRAAVDAGFAPNDYQVGQTGKIVAPELYIAIGISGAIQHLAGMKDSRVIVAINKDPEAPIFKMATYGLVGDLFQIIPELIAELDK